MNTYSFFFSTPIPPERIEEILGHNDFKVDNEEKVFTYYFKDEIDFSIIYRHCGAGNDDGYFCYDQNDDYYQQYF